MRLVTPAAAKLAAWIAIPAALIASGIVVGTASYSAFSATTSNPTSNWTAGSVALTNDGGATALFNAGALKPGSTGTNCIAVTSNGTTPASVKLYGTNPSTTLGFSSYVNLTVTQGIGGGFGSCATFVPLVTSPVVYSGTLANFATTSTNFATGVGSWTTTGVPAETRVFQFTYTVSALAPNSVQGGTAALGFTWEAQSN